ncbi:MAG: arylsulfatase [Lentimonas sp.]
MKTKYLKSFLAQILLMMLVGQSCAFAESRPNIIVIYTDDQGYGDVSALNPEARFKTPNLDRLVHEGIAFTNGHSADSVCTPSRYALLTGRYPWRTKRKSGVLGAEAACMIVDGRMTLASLLKDNGYHTAMVGKWHLGMDFPGTPKNRDWSQPIKDMPLDKGFDYFYGIPASLNYGVLAWFEGRYAKVPPTMYTNKKKNPLYLDYRIMPPFETKPGTSKDPTRTVKKNFEIAEDFIDNQCLTRFTDKAIEWMEGKTADAKLAHSTGSEQGKPFFLYLPYTSPHYPVCPLPEFQGQGEAGAYGEFVIETDYHVGRILEFLKTNGLDENTLVVYSSDNGPEKSWTSRLEETGHDSRGGYRMGKRSVYEGGHRVPFMMRWPVGIAEPGREWSGVVGQTDILATFADLLGEKLPENMGEDSQSFASVLLDAKAKHKRLPLINRSNEKGDGRYAITDGNWKLVLPKKKGEAELYDLDADPAETRNLAATHPEKVQQLQKQATEIVVNGRTTPGAVQPNDTGYWKELTWMTEADFQ